MLALFELHHLGEAVDRSFGGAVGRPTCVAVLGGAEAEVDKHPLAGACPKVTDVGLGAVDHPHDVDRQVSGDVAGIGVAQ